MGVPKLELGGCWRVGGEHHGWQRVRGDIAAKIRARRRANKGKVGEGYRYYLRGRNGSFFFTFVASGFRVGLGGGEWIRAGAGETKI